MLGGLELDLNVLSNTNYSVILQLYDTVIARDKYSTLYTHDETRALYVMDQVYEGTNRYLRGAQCWEGLDSKCWYSDKGLAPGCYSFPSRPFPVISCPALKPE